MAAFLNTSVVSIGVLIFKGVAVFLGAIEGWGRVVIGSSQEGSDTVYLTPNLGERLVEAIHPTRGRFWVGGGVSCER